MNEEILAALDGFTIDGAAVPVAFARYEGHGEPYIVFSCEDNAQSYSADDTLQGWVTYYDFDIYTTGDYRPIVEAVRARLEAAGWTWQPSRSQFDMYESDTGYYHVTANFAKERD